MNKLFDLAIFQLGQIALVAAANAKQNNGAKNSKATFFLNKLETYLKIT